MAQQATQQQKLKDRVAANLAKFCAFFAPQLSQALPPPFQEDSEQHEDTAEAQSMSITSVSTPSQPPVRVLVFLYTILTRSHVSPP